LLDVVDHHSAKHFIVSLVFSGQQKRLPHEYRDFIWNRKTPNQIAHFIAASRAVVAMRWISTGN
jgi:hypothetical protein